MLFVYVGLFAFGVLAFWKLYELIFGVVSKRNEVQKKTLDLMTVFFAEFTYKAINGSSEYKDAPKEVYNWLETSFKEWSDSYIKRIAKKVDK